MGDGNEVASASRATPEELRDALLRRAPLDAPAGVLLDYDGTLTEIVPSPELAVLDAATGRALARLAASGRAKVGIITGRTEESLREVGGGLAGIDVAANGGLRLRGPSGEWVHPLGEERSPLLRQLFADLREYAARHPGAWVEDKTLSLAVHYRACPEAGPALRARIDERFAATPGAFRLVSGKAVHEVQLALEWDKGRAAQVLLERWGCGARALFAGDDTIDEPAFARVRELGGVTCRVGAPEEATAAQWLLASPAECRRLVALLAEALG